MTFFSICVSKAKLLIVFVDSGHTGEYNFVINNYLLPTHTSEKTWKIQLGPELTRTPNSAKQLSSMPAFTSTFAKPAELWAPEGQLCVLQPQCQSFQISRHPLDIQLNNFQSLLDTAKLQGCLWLIFKEGLDLQTPEKHLKQERPRFPWPCDGGSKVWHLGNSSPTAKAFASIKCGNIWSDFKNKIKLFFIAGAFTPVSITSSFHIIS